MKRAFILTSAVTLITVLCPGLIRAETWTTQKIASEAGGANVAVEKSNVYVVWSEADGGTPVRFRRSKNGGRTWLPPKTLGRADDSGRAADIVAVGSAVYVAWANEKSDILFAKSTDRGGSWKAAQKLCVDKDDSSRPALAVSGSIVYVAWENFNVDGWHLSLFLRKSPDGGATWQPIQKLVVDTNCRFPALAASGKNIYLVWQDDDDSVSDVYFRKSSDGGVSWSSAQKLCATPRRSEGPRISAAGTELFVTWQEQTSSNFNADILLRKSADGGTTWQAAKKLTGTPGDTQNPAVAVFGSSVFLAWNDDTKGNDEIYVRKSTSGGAAWQAAQRLTRTAASSLFPRLAVSATAVHVVWVDGEYDRGDIFLCSAPLGGASAR